MSHQSVQEFVKNSNVVISRENPKNLVMHGSERTVLERRQHVPVRLEKKIVNNSNFSEFLNVSNSNNDNNRVPELIVSRLNMGMFNATVNRMLEPFDRLNLVDILKKTPVGNTNIGNGLYVDTKELRGIYGRFKIGFTHTREDGPSGNIEENFFSVQLAIDVSNGYETKGWTVNIYKNGKIRFSGGFVGADIEGQAEAVQKYVMDTYTERQPYLYNPFEYNNLSGQFKINGVFTDMAAIAAKQRVYEFDAATYDPELIPFLYITYKRHKFILAKTGNVQISGAINPSSVLKSYMVGIELMNKLNDNGHVTIKRERITDMRRKNSSSCPKNRQPPCKPGFEERKNKKGFTCCYKIPKKKRVTPIAVRGAALPVINGDRIGTKKCDRYSQSELYDIARRLGIVNIKKTTKKDVLCEMIKKAGGEKAQVAAFKNNGKEYRMTGSGESFRVGKKMAKFYTKNDLIRFAKIMKINVTTNNDKMSIARKMEKERNARATMAKKPKTPPPPKPTRKNIIQQKRNVEREKVLKRRGLDENSVRNDIIRLYGKRWMARYKNVMPPLRNDVRQMKTKLDGMGRLGNKRGIPFKRDVDVVKKRMVERWKRERERDLEQKIIKNQLNTKNIPNGLINRYKNAATNYIMTRGPTMKQLENYKKTWLNLQNKK
jgi:hypothetical protein